MTGPRTRDGERQSGDDKSEIIRKGVLDVHRVLFLFRFVWRYFAYYLDQKNRHNSFYAWCRKHLRVRKKDILYEAYGGRGMIGNPYAIYLNALTRPHLSRHTHIWVLKDKADISLFREENPGVRLRFVLRDTMPYYHALATAGTLVQNASFGVGCFSKRPDQVYLNTWHGTALKTIGLAVPGGVSTSRRPLFNMLNSDFILSPNEFMSEVFRDSFRLQGIYGGKLIEEGYPRNDLVIHANREEVLNKLSRRGVRIERDKKLILYAPTWRGASVQNVTNSADDYPGIYERLIPQIDQRKYQLLIKPHQLAYRFVTKEQQIAYNYIPPSMETNELLSCVDILISDFSSIYFDFLLTGRPVLFYIPDKDNYEAERGTYEKIRQMPGPVTDQIDDIARWIGDIDRVVAPYREAYEKTKEWACQWDDGQSSARVCDILFGGVEDKYRIKRDFVTKKPRVLISAGKLADNRATHSLIGFLQTLDQSAFDVTVTGQTVTKNIPMAERMLQAGARVVLEFSSRASTNFDRACVMYCERRPLNTSFSHKVYPDHFFEAEYTHRFGNAHFDIIIEWTGTDAYAQLLLRKGSGAKRFLVARGNYKLMAPDDFAPIMAPDFIEGPVTGDLCEGHEEAEAKRIQKNEEALKFFFASIESAQPGDVVVIEERDLWASDWVQEKDILRVALETPFSLSAAWLVGSAKLDEHSIGCTVEGTMLSVPFLPIAQQLVDAPGRYALHLEDENGIRWRVRLRDIKKIPVWRRYLYGVPLPEYVHKALYACANGAGCISLWARTPVHGRGDSFSLIDQAVVLRYKDTGDAIEIKARISLLPDVCFDENLSLFLRNTETDQDIEIHADRISRRDTKRGCVLMGWFSKEVLREKMIPFTWHIMVRGSVEGKPVLLRVTDLSFGLYREMTRIHRPDSRLDETHLLLPQHNQYAVYLCYRLASEVDAEKSRKREALALLIYRFTFLGIRKKPIILFEKMAKAAQDNGFALFEYYQNEKKADNAYYVMDENSPQAYKLRPYWDHVLVPGSLKYYLYILSARLLVGSDGHRHLYDINHGFGRTVNKLARKKIFFLQHGVTAFKRLVPFFSWKSRYFDYFAATNTLERQIIHEQLHYPMDRIPLLGFCRWDKLNRARPEGPRSILLFPTWRKWLDGKGDQLFLESDYYERIMGLIEDPVLWKLLDENGIVMNVFLHPKMENFTAQLLSNAGSIRIMSGENADLSELVYKCDMVITDYSSIAWDFAYQRKPVLLYQFDREKYLQLTGAYIDISEPILGPVTTEKADALRVIEGYIERDFTIEPEFREKIDSLFDFPDECCKATDQFIQETALPARIVKRPQNYSHIVAREIVQRWRGLCVVNESQEVPVGSAMKRIFARIAVSTYDALRRSGSGVVQVEESEE